jgi:hypothetical protein
MEQKEEGEYNEWDSDQSDKVEDAISMVYKNGNAEIMGKVSKRTVTLIGVCEAEGKVFKVNMEKMVRGDKSDQIYRKVKDSVLASLQEARRLIRKETRNENHSESDEKHGRNFNEAFGNGNRTTFLQSKPFMDMFNKKMMTVYMMIMDEILIGDARDEAFTEYGICGRNYAGCAKLELGFNTSVNDGLIWLQAKEILYKTINMRMTVAVWVHIQIMVKMLMEAQNNPAGFSRLTVELRALIVYAYGGVDKSADASNSARIEWTRSKVLDIDLSGVVLRPEDQLDNKIYLLLNALLICALPAAPVNPAESYRPNADRAGRAWTTIAKSSAQPATAVVEDRRSEILADQVRIEDDKWETKMVLVSGLDQTDNPKDVEDALKELFEMMGSNIVEISTCFNRTVCGLASAIVSCHPALTVGALGDNDVLPKVMNTCISVSSDITHANGNTGTIKNRHLQLTFAPLSRKREDMIKAPSLYFRLIGNNPAVAAHSLDTIRSCLEKKAGTRLEGMILTLARELVPPGHAKPKLDYFYVQLSVSADTPTTAPLRLLVKNACELVNTTGNRVWLGTREVRAAVYTSFEQMAKAPPAVSATANPLICSEWSMMNFTTRPSDILRAIYDGGVSNPDKVVAVVMLPVQTTQRKGTASEAVALTRSAMVIHEEGPTMMPEYRTELMYNLKSNGHQFVTVGKAKQVEGFGEQARRAEHEAKARKNAHEPPSKDVNLISTTKSVSKPSVSFPGFFLASSMSSTPTAQSPRSDRTTAVTAQYEEWTENRSPPSSSEVYGYPMLNTSYQQTPRTTNQLSRVQQESQQQQQKQQIKSATSNSSSFQVLLNQNSYAMEEESSSDDDFHLTEDSVQAGTSLAVLSANVGSNTENAMGTSVHQPTASDPILTADTTDDTELTAAKASSEAIITQLLAANAEMQRQFDALLARVAAAESKAAESSPLHSPTGPCNMSQESITSLGSNTHGVGTNDTPSIEETGQPLALRAKSSQSTIPFGHPTFSAGAQLSKTSPTAPPVQAQTPDRTAGVARHLPASLESISPEKAKRKSEKSGGHLPPPLPDTIGASSLSDPTPARTESGSLIAQREVTFAEVPAAPDPKPSAASK